MADLSIDVRVSGICQMTSVLVTSAGRCLLLDAGYFPREMEELSALVRSRGVLKALALSHHHWDHVLGPTHFPDALVWVSEVLAQDITEAGELSRAGLAEARQFDERWYVQRPGSHCWPAKPSGLSDGERRRIGEITVQALLVPGHSRDGLALLLEEGQVLLCGDYLSPCEIPIVEDFDAYYRTLHRFTGLLDGGVREVIPGHGWAMTCAQAREVAKEDLAYLYQLMFFRDSGDLKGARHMLLPRLSDNPIMRELHLQNCRKLGLAGD